MARYGYRLFTIELREGNRRKAANFKDCPDKHYAETAHRLLNSLKDRLVLGLPHSDRPSEDAGDVSEDDPHVIGERAMRVESVGRDGNMITTTIWVGSFGDHELAIGNGVDDADLTDRAPSRRYRVLMNLPDDGTVGMLAVEDITRSCPVDFFVRWLGRVARDEAFAATKGEEEVKWWRPVVFPAADNQQLETMLRRGDVERLVLVRHDVSMDRTRAHELFRLQAPRVAPNRRQVLLEAVKSWMPTRSGADGEGTTRPSDREGARQLAAIIGPQIESLDFDDGWVVLKEGSKTKKISPSRFSEVFIYPLDEDRRPSDVAFFRSVKETSQRLQRPLALTLDWPEL